MSKKKKLKRIVLPANCQEYYDIDYWNKLSHEEKQWITEFMDGTLGNNHRMYEMFTKHEDYDRIKKEIYSETNQRNRDVYSKSKAGDRLYSIDFLSDTKEERYISKILSNKLSRESKEQVLLNFGIKGFEEISRSLIETTIDEIQNVKSRNHFSTLINFYINLNILIKEENKSRRS